MTEEEKQEYWKKLTDACRLYCHIDYDDDMEIMELMLDVALKEMAELIPNFDRYGMTSRQKLLVLASVKELYDSREKYQKEGRTLTNAVSSMLLKEMHGGVAK